MKVVIEDAERFSEEYTRITNLSEDGDVSTAIREAGRLFEELCKNIIQSYLPKVDFATRKMIFDKESEIGRGSKGLCDFTFGQVIGIWRDTNITKAIEAIERRSIRAVSNVNLDSICSLRNEAVHQGAEFQPETYDVQYVLGSLQVFLLFFGIKISQPEYKTAPKTVAEVSGLLEEMFSTVEILEGVQPFYRRLSEIIERPEIDTYDLTYLLEFPPKPLRSGKDSRREYFSKARERVIEGNARLRRIVTFSNHPKSAWILFNLVAAHADVFDIDFRLSYFDARRGNGSNTVMIPNIALYYSSEDVASGTAWIYSAQEDDHQNFIGLSGKSVFPTMRRLYASWFRSCDVLTESKAAQMYEEIFGRPDSEADLKRLYNEHRDAIGLDPEAAKKSIDFWARAFQVS